MTRKIMKIAVDRCQIDSYVISQEKCMECKWSGGIWITDRPNKPFTIKIHCKFDPKKIAEII